MATSVSDTCACLRARVCAHVCVRLISGLSIRSGLYAIKHYNLFHVGLFMFVFYLQVTWHNEKRLITQLNLDLTRRGTW